MPTIATLPWRSPVRALAQRLGSVQVKLDLVTHPTLVRCAWCRTITGRAGYMRPLRHGRRAITDGICQPCGVKMLEG